MSYRKNGLRKEVIAKERPLEFRRKRERDTYFEGGKRKSTTWGKKEVGKGLPSILRAFIQGIWKGSP